MSDERTAVVVAIDFAEMTDDVLAAAIGEAARRESPTLHAVCAIDPSLDVSDIDLGIDFSGELSKLEEALEARIRGPIGEAGLRYQAHAMLGAPASAIADVAQQFSADLIVCGRHSRRDRAASLGSVPAKILGLAHCSVLVVQPSDYR